MFIWIQDHGVYGCIVVVAATEERARELMVGQYNYSKKQSLEKFAIEENLIWVNLGDC